MGSSTIISKRHAFRCDPGRTVQVKITEFCSTPDCIWSRNGSKQWKAELSHIDDSCKTSFSSDDDTWKLQGLERCCGTRISHQESKRKESLRWEESGRVFSLEDTWTMFKRRLMLFQSWQTSTRRLVRWSETKRTIVLSSTKFEGQDWRRGRKVVKNIRQLRWKLFRQKERNSVPLHNL